MKNKTCYLLIAHGSKDHSANEVFFELVRQFRAILPGKKVEGCFLEAASPRLAESLQTGLNEGVEVFIILPLLLFPGRHVQKDIPEILANFRMKYPDVDFHYASPLGMDPLLLELLAKKAELLDRVHQKQSVKKSGLK